MLQFGHLKPVTMRPVLSPLHGHSPLLLPEGQTPDGLRRAREHFAEHDRPPYTALLRLRSSNVAFGPKLPLHPTATGKGVSFVQKGPFGSAVFCPIKHKIPPGPSGQKESHTRASLAFSDGTRSTEASINPEKERYNVTALTCQASVEETGAAQGAAFLLDTDENAHTWKVIAEGARRHGIPCSPVISDTTKCDLASHLLSELDERCVTLIARWSHHVCVCSVKEIRELRIELRRLRNHAYFR